MNDAKAEYYILKEFRKFAARTPEATREDYFDPRNRDNYMRDFAAHLSKPTDFASND